MTKERLNFLFGFCWRGQNRQSFSEKSHQRLPAAQANQNQEISERTNDNKRKQLINISKRQTSGKAATTGRINHVFFFFFFLLFEWLIIDGATSKHMKVQPHYGASDNREGLKCFFIGLFGSQNKKATKKSQANDKKAFFCLLRRETLVKFRQLFCNYWVFNSCFRTQP